MFINSFMNDPSQKLCDGGPRRRAVSLLAVSLLAVSLLAVSLL
jgi:hypothetical protein